MRRKNLTHLLLKARDEGLSIAVTGEDLAVTPGGRISTELRACTRVARTFNKNRPWSNETLTKP